MLLLKKLGQILPGSARFCYTQVTVKEALKVENVGKKLTVQGWVKAARLQKANAFVDIDDGLTIGGRKLQVVAAHEKVPENLTYHCAINVQGTLKKSDHPAQEVELVTDAIDVVTPILEKDNYPFQPRKRYDDDYPRAYPHYRAKLNDFASLLRLRSGLSHAFHDYFRSKDFIQIHTPVLTSNDCEGAGELFLVTPADEKVSKKMLREGGQDLSEAYFDTKVFLNVSGQLHLEAICNGLQNVYTFNSAFRAEMGRSRRHLSEFSMIEAEVAFLYNMSDLLFLQEDLIKSVIEQVLSTHSPDIEAYLHLNSLKQRVKKKGIESSLHHVETILKNKFIVMTYKEAFDALEKANESWQTKPCRTAGLGNEHELYLAGKYCSNVPVFIVDWPQELKAFYARRSKKDEGLVLASDLLFPAIGELCGGSLREDNHQVLTHTIGDRPELQWYLDLRGSGAAPMGGFGLGFERLVQFLLKIPNIRDAVPFSRSPHNCKL